jgi:hypothetical protein
MATNQNLILKKKTLYGFVLAFIFALVSSAKFFGSSPDLIQYQLYFNKISLYDFNSRYEPGFEYLNIIFKTIFGPGSFTFLIFFIAFLSLILKFLFLTKRRDWPILIFIYITCAMILHEFIQIRAGLAIAISILALNYSITDNPKFFRKLIFLAVACSFHISSIFFAPFILAPAFFKSRNRFIIFVYASLVFALGKFSPGFIEMLTGNSAQLTQSYLSVFDDTTATIFSARNLALLTILTIGFFRIKDFKKNTLPFYYISLAGFSFWFGFLWFPLLSNRILELTIFSCLAWLPDLKKDFRICAYIVMSAFGIYYSYNLTNMFI